MLARARCGRALVAWPASSIVATQVVRSVAFQLGSFAATSAIAFASSGFLTRAFIASATSSSPLAAWIFGHCGEVRAACVVELRGEVVGLDPLERAGEVIDRVVLDRPRAVSARVGHFQPVVLRKLLAGLDLQGDAVSLRVQLAPGAFVDGELRVDEILPVLCEPLRAVERTAGFFAAGERELQRSARFVVLLAVTHQRIDPDRRFSFVVERAARVEEPFSSTSLNGSRVQSSRLASTTSMWASSRIDLSFLSRPG